MSYPYTLNTGKLPKFLDHIQSAGIPDKLSQTYLAATEFKSSNDRALVAVMKFIGFTDSSGVPTDRWKRYRDRSQAEAVMADGIRHGYSELFRMYPDANKQSADTIKNFMASKSSVGDKALSAMVTTFRTLCDRADFDSDSGSLNQNHDAASGVSDPATASVKHKNARVGRADVQIEIKVELPSESSDPEIYEKIFSAMRKHLLSDD